MHESIPIIDISDLFSGDLEAKKVVAKQIQDACNKIGFFAIKGHGIDCFDQLIKEAYRFFKVLTYEQKLELAPFKWNPNNKNTYRGYFPAINGKEGLDLGNPYIDENHDTIKRNLPLQEVLKWPAESAIPGFRSFVTEYYARMTSLAKVLLSGFALAAGRDENFFENKLNLHDTMSTLRFNYYPFTREDLKPVEIAPDGTKLGCETHCDGSVITILYQPDVGGLQVENNGSWVDVEPSKSMFVINTGRCMSLLANGDFKPALHRVKMSNEERFSVPFFTEFGCETVLKDCALYESEYLNNNPTLTYGQYIAASNKNFKEYQRA